MTQHAVRDIDSGSYFTEPVFLDEKYILLSPETPVTDRLLGLLQDWQFDVVFTEGSPSAAPTEEFTVYESSESAGAGTDESAKDAAGLQEAQRSYRHMCEFTEKLFTTFVTKSELSVRTITEKVKELIGTVRSHKRYLLRTNALSETGSNYVVEQSVQTAILSITIALTLKLPPHKLIELGTTALLHEIGMVRLPPQLYMSNNPLSPRERKTLSAHTLLGFKILKQYAFPLSVCLSVLECREYLNGSGYPRGLTAEKISLNAKIVMVAGAYAAMTSKRPYREARDGHSVLLELLKDRNTLYDETVLRALVLNLSVYPIGTYVMLANGSWGLVVNTEDRPPRAPDVQVLISPDGRRHSEAPIADTTTQPYQIIRALRTDEVAQMSKGANASA